ncbi:MAG TPA: lasso RiPP family leader peptide-containing protein [Sorangium sp.]|nr:lasso RiPP family leader peptide-containing protein [Sorangium sp.]
MSDQHPKSAEQAATKDGKRPYHKPELVEHGDVATLTQGGAGTTPEGGGGMAGFG